MPTPNYGLPILTGTEPYSLKNVSNQDMNAVDSALGQLATSAGRTFFSAADRDSFFGPTPANRTRIFRSDLLIWEVYVTGGGWVPIIGNPYTVVNGVWSMPAAGGFVTVGSTTHPWTEISDRLDWHSPSLNPSRITPNISGVYRVVANLRWSTNGVDQRLLRVLKTGNEIASASNGQPATSSSTGLETAYSVGMNGTSDYFELQAFQNSGSTLSVTGNLTVEYLGPL